MARRLRISDATRFAVEYSVTKLLRDLQPFIKSLAADVMTSGRIRESVLKAIEDHPEASRYLTIHENTLEETFGLRDEYALQEWSPRALLVHDGVKSLSINLESSSLDQMTALHELLVDMSLGTKSIKSIATDLDEPLAGIFQGLLRNGNVLESDRSPLQIAPDGVPGVYRLQHASLLYRTNTTGILVDPHLHSTFDPGLTCTISRPDLEGKVDAILISHSHQDHWSLSTLMMFPPETLIVVPKVPGPTVICDDMERRLRGVGFRNVMAVDWDSDPIVIGDFELFVFPFFGEQPLRYERSRHPHMRNWGNTYVVRSKFYTSWFLIDSGADVDGSMLDVAENVKRRLGRVDFVLSNLRKFFILGPTYINGGLNWLTLSPSQMLHFDKMRNHCITLGAENVARICRTVAADYYLPYAHWWGELGQVGNSGDDPTGQEELGLVRDLDQWIRKLSCTTSIIPWKIGEGFVASSNGFRLLTARKNP